MGSIENRYYDPEMGRFISTDPLGYVDGPSLYGFAGNDPVGSGDPFGLYEEDVHDFLTRYLAQAAGFSRRRAEEIGVATFELDLDDRSAMHGAGANHANMSAFHFVTRDQLHTLRDSAFLVTEQMDEEKLRTIGEFFHALQDTFAHQKNRNRRDFGEYYSGGPLRIGHGLRGHTPDWTWESPDLAMQMAFNVYRYMVALCQRFESNCQPKRFEELRTTLDEFFRFDELDFYEEWVPIGKYGIDYWPTTDVVDYTPKIKVLDPSYSLTADERNVRATRVRESGAIQAKKDRARRARRGPRY